MNFKSCTIRYDSDAITPWVDPTEQYSLEKEEYAPVSLDPTDRNFDFSLWAIAVKKQMLAVVQKHPDNQ